METQSAFMAAAAAAVLVVAILLRRRDPPALLLCGLGTAFAAWALGRGSTAIGVQLGAGLSQIALGGMGPLALAFAWSLGAQVPAARQILPALALAGLAVAGLPLLPGVGEGPLARVPVMWAGALVVASAVLLRRGAAPSRLEDLPEQTRLRYVATSHLLIVPAILGDAILGAFDAPRGLTYFAGLLYLYVAYLHLSRVRVVDLRQLFGNTLALALIAAGLVGFFAALHLWVGARTDLFVLNAFVASFLLLLFLEPLGRAVQYTMDRWLVGGKIALARSLAPLRSRLTQVLTLDELLREFLHTLERSERVTASSIFLRDDPRMGFQLAAAVGLPPGPRLNLIRDPELLEALQEGEPLLVEDRERLEAEAPGGTGARPSGLLKILRELDTQVVIPLRSGTNLVGFWTLSHADSTEPFSSEEVRLLRGLADQAAVSIENSKTFERIRARDRLVSLGEMAAGLAHEIRNPIATIRGALSLLEKPGKDDPEEIRRVVVEEVQRLDRVVGLFLDYARPAPSRASPHDVGQVLEGAVRGTLALRNGVRVELDVEPGLEALPIDGERLERIVSNLVRNACEACGPGSTVQVTARASGTIESSGLEILVADEGSGMDEDTLSRAFVPFFTTKPTGVGLGLALCERLVRAQGGQIELRSEVGRGTRARIWIPMASETDEGGPESVE